MIALKLDIDTRRGMEEGLPRLLELLKARGARASVFFSYGPDESGKAVKRVFTRKGFLKKMFRTNAARLYGFKTMLYGTLLPAPPVASALPELVLRTRGEGHETGVHAWSHVRWQDDLDTMSPVEIMCELGQAVAAHKRITGEQPAAFAAPAWKINRKALDELVKYPWKYVSLARGAAMALPSLLGTSAPFPEIPTTLPTLDEILAWDGMNADSALEYLAKAPQKGRLNVYTLHSEAEGLSYLDFFGELLKRWRQAGFQLSTLSDTLAGMDISKLPRTEIREGMLPGRGGKVAVICRAGATEV